MRGTGLTAAARKTLPVEASVTRYPSVWPTMWTAPLYRGLKERVWGPVLANGARKPPAATSDAARALALA
eukprot:1747883-Alexandrium_andersonii.AAC.1